MRIAYLECFAGIAGDMFLGALVDAGVDPVLLQRAAESLDLGVQLEFKKVDRSGIQATKARVLVDGVDAELVADHSGKHSHPHDQHDHAHDQHEHEHAHTHTHTHTDERGHVHTHTHTHSHAHEVPHVHGRSLKAICQLIENASVTSAAKRIAILAFQKLGAAEAKVHGVAIESVHFHEVGAVDAIVDIVCSAVGADALGVDAWYGTPVNTGSGFVDCAHGRFPVPAPATLELLGGVPTYAEGPAKELTTPTGAALLAALDCRFIPVPAWITHRAGYGAGTRNPERFPNVLRLRVGEVQAPSTVAAAFTEGDGSATGRHDTVSVLTCAIDDATAETLAFAAESLLAHGALDVMQQPAFMKKGRQGTLLTVICRPADAGLMEDLLFRETTTLGVRVREEKRSKLHREIVVVATEFGEVRVKLGLRDGTVMNAAPEFEDCRIAAESHGVPLKQAMLAALLVYFTDRAATQTTGVAQSS